MLTIEQLQNIMYAIQEHPNAEEIYSRLENAICEELEVKASVLAEAIIDNDTDGVIRAFTGWDMEALLEKARIIPAKSGSWPSLSEKESHVVFPVMPWEKDTTEPVFLPFLVGKQTVDDYTLEYCPECENEVVIRAKGISACPSCGKPIAPCSTCELQGGANAPCPEGCCGNHVITNSKISQQEIDWYMEQI